MTLNEQFDKARIWSIRLQSLIDADIALNQALSYAVEEADDILAIEDARRVLQRLAVLITTLR
jgi:hypothetical protein